MRNQKQIIVIFIFMIPSMNRLFEYHIFRQLDQESMSAIFIFSRFYQATRRCFAM